MLVATPVAENKMPTPVTVVPPGTGPLFVRLNGEFGRLQVWLASGIDAEQSLTGKTPGLINCSPKLIFALVGGPLKTIQFGSLKATPIGSGPLLMSVFDRLVIVPLFPASPENEPVSGIATLKIPGVPVAEANNSCVKFTVTDPFVDTNPVIGDA